MKKIIISLVAMFAAVTGSYGQIATENAKVFDNIYLGVEGGVTTPLNFNSMFPVNAAAGLKFGKEITPVFGAEVEGFFFFNENNFREWTKTFVKGSELGLNGTMNLSNLFGGYNGSPRPLEFKVNAGLGWLHFLNGGGNALTAKTALDVNFNFGAKKQHTLFVSPGVYWDLRKKGAMEFNKNYAQLAVFAGYVYHFKTSNGTHHFKTYDVGAMIGEIDRLNEELAKCQSKPQAVEAPVEKVTTVFRDHYVEMTRIVNFALDSYELDKDAKAILDNVKGTVDIYGYASPEGTEEYNKELSQKRADAVAEYLTNIGVKVNSAVGMGVVGIASNRIAIVHNIDEK